MLGSAAWCFDDETVQLREAILCDDAHILRQCLYVRSLSPFIDSLLANLLTCSSTAPHVGHMYSIVLADVLKRWQVLQGNRALLCTGTDEHGMKVQQAAAREGRPPKELCDDYADMFKDLARNCNVDNDFFIRTTDPDHVSAVQHFWKRLKDGGYIYESKHEGWYCVGDECFYPESMVETRYVPLTGKTIMASVETGNQVEWTQEKNYHFRMTALKYRLLEFYEANPKFIVPRSRMNEVVDWVKNNLEDLSISRPSDRLDWGIRVPDDPTQTIYVWVDALVNYITKAGYPHWELGREHVGGWPADVQVIGKDIVRFHGIYWPALLLALDLPPPRQLLCHAHWTMGKKKMSKSVGNVVNPFFAIDRFGVDLMRWYLVHDGGIEDDSDYGNELIVSRFKHSLKGQLGNLLSRVTRTQSWKFSNSVERARADEAMPLERGSLPPDTVLDDRSLEKINMTDEDYRELYLKETDQLRQTLVDLRDQVAGHMSDLNPSLAAKMIMGVVADVSPQTRNGPKCHPANKCPSRRIDTCPPCSRGTSGRKRQCRTRSSLPPPKRCASAAF
jgi:methionyl-tRNA synthetase